MKNKLSLSTRCSLAFIACMALYYPTVIMFSSYMLLLNFSSADVAKYLTVFGICLVCTKPFFSPIIDKGHSKMLVFSAFTAMILGTLFFFLSPVKTALHAIVYVIAISGCASIAIEGIDVWIAKLSAEYEEADYSKARSFGSLAFAFTGLVYGVALSRIGIMLAPAFIILMVVLSAIACMMMPEPKVAKKEEGETKTKGSFSIFADRSVVVFMLFFAIGFCVVEMTDNYIGVLILEKGGTTAHTGIHDFIKCVLECIVLYNFSKLEKHFSVKAILIAGMIGLTVKATAVALMPTAFLAVCTCITHAFTFPLVAPSKIRVLEKLVPHEHMAFAMTMAGVICSLMMTVLINPLMAYLIPIIGTAYTVVVISACGLISAAGLYLTLKK